MFSTQCRPRFAAVIVALLAALVLSQCTSPLTPGPPVTPELTFTPAAGTYTEAVSLVVACTQSAAELYFTSDGNEPTVASTPYVPGFTLITIYSSATIRAIAVVDGEVVAQGSAEYLIDRQDMISATVIGAYTNPTGSDPAFDVDEESIPEALRFSPVVEATANAASRSVSIAFNNLNVYSGGSNYYLQDVTVEESVAGEWYEDVEFTAHFDFLTRIAVALVLDCSNSLGTDFTQVQQYAKQFVDIVKTNSPNALVGIVDFSTNVSLRALSDSTTAVGTYIDGLEQDQYTAYYDAILKGLDILSGTVFPESSFSPFAPVLSPTLSWTAITAAQGYQLQVSTSDTFGTTVVDDDTITADVLSYTLSSELTAETEYYWRVRAKTGASTWGSWPSTPDQFTPTEVQGLAVVSFTDGADNYSREATYDSLILDIAARGIKSYTMGLEGNGNLNPAILEGLAVNGSYDLASSLADLQAIFTAFSGAVSNVYQAVYTRNDVPIATPRQIRFTFTATLDPDGSVGPTGVVILQSSEDFEAATTLPTGWTGTWTVDTSQAASGTHSLRSQSIGGSSSSSVQLTRTTVAAGTITFSLKVSSEANYDFLTFKIDGSQPSSGTSRWSGNVSWTEATFSLPAGSHTLSWTYSKDGGGVAGSDAAWIDDVSFE